MSVILTQVPVAGNSTVPAFFLPAGLCNFTVYQPSTPQQVFIGTTPNVSASNGLPVPVTPFQQENYNTSRGTFYYATTGNATASTFYCIISTGN